MADGGSATQGGQARVAAVSRGYFGTLGIALHAGRDCGRWPAVLAFAGLAFVAVVVPACYLPARRATRVDPAVTLRCE
jgi:uncharacterized iron-regulated membrane protein